MKAGYVNPNNLLFAKAHVARMRDVSPQVPEALEDLDVAYAAIHRDHPFHRSPDFVAALRDLIDQPRFRSILGLPQS